METQVQIDHVYNKALNKYGSYLKSVARRMCSRRGLSTRIDEDDFYQIASLSLLEAIKSWNKEVDHPEFEYHLKTVLRHDCLDEIQHETAGMRDFRREKRDSEISPEDCSFMSTQAINTSAASYMELKEAAMRIRNLLGSGVNIDGKHIPDSGSDEFYLFNELIHTTLYGPTELLDRVFQEYQDEKFWYLECPECGYVQIGYSEVPVTCQNPYEPCMGNLSLKGGRRHEKIPLAVYALRFNWTRSYARKVLSNIRKIMIESEGLDPNFFIGRA